MEARLAHRLGEAEPGAWLRCTTTTPGYGIRQNDVPGGDTGCPRGPVGRLSADIGGQLRATCRIGGLLNTSRELA